MLCFCLTHLASRRRKISALRQLVAAGYRVGGSPSGLEWGVFVRRVKGRNGFRSPCSGAEPSFEDGLHTLRTERDLTLPKHCQFLWKARSLSQHNPPTQQERKRVLLLLFTAKLTQRGDVIRLW